MEKFPSFSWCIDRRKTAGKDGCGKCGDARDVYAEEQGDGYMDVSWWP